MDDPGRSVCKCPDNTKWKERRNRNKGELRCNEFALRLESAKTGITKERERHTHRERERDRAFGVHTDASFWFETPHSFPSSSASGPRRLFEAAARAACFPLVAPGLTTTAGVAAALLLLVPPLLRFAVLLLLLDLFDPDFLFPSLFVPPEPPSAALRFLLCPPAGLPGDFRFGAAFFVGADRQVEFVPSLPSGVRFAQSSSNQYRRCDLAAATDSRATRTASMRF